jgi:hypothetical protein
MGRVGGYRLDDDWSDNFGPDHEDISLWNPPDWAENQWQAKPPKVRESRRVKKTAVPSR